MYYTCITPVIQILSIPMKIPQITLVHNRRKLPGASSVEVRLTCERKQKYLSTGISIYPHEWKNGRVVSRDDALYLNQMLDKIVYDIRQIIIDMSKTGEVDISEVLKKYNSPKEREENFIDFCKRRSEIRKYGNTKDSQERYDRFIRLFLEWGKITDFKDVTESNIIAYDRYLKQRGLKDYSKWNNYHRFLNSFIMDAIDEGLMQKNPYRWININRGKKTSTSRYLTPEEFGKISSVKLAREALIRTRDLFIFQTYTCLSYSDLKEFKTNNIKEVNGMKVYTGKRKKTHNSFTIPMMKPALEILDKYEGNLPIISNVKYNEYLKEVTKAAGIHKPVSTHWARHTGATLLLNEGIDISIIAKICGHSSTRITEQVYAKMLDETIVDAISKIDK